MQSRWVVDVNEVLIAERVNPVSVLWTNLPVQQAFVGVPVFRELLEMGSYPQARLLVESNNAELTWPAHVQATSLSCFLFPIRQWSILTKVQRGAEIL